MKVFQLFFKIVWSKKGFYLMYIGILVGFFYGIMSSFNKDQPAEVYIVEPTIGIVNQDEQNLSRDLVEYLSGKYKVREIPNSEEKIQDRLFDNNISYALILEKGFSESVRQNDPAHYRLYGGVEKNINDMLSQDINEYLYYTNLYSSLVQQPLSAADADWVKVQVSEVLDSEIKTSVAVAEEKDLNAYIVIHYFLLQVIFSLIAIGFISVGNSIVVMETPNLKLRDRVSGYPEWKRGSSMILAGFIWMTLIWLVLVMVGFGFSDFSIITKSRTLLMLLSSFAHLLTMTCFFVLFANLIPSSHAMTFLSTMLSLVVAFSCGIFVPRDLVADELQYVSQIFPAYWDVSNQMEITFRAKEGEIDMNFISRNILIMLAMGVGAFLLTILIRKIKQRKSA